MTYKPPYAVTSDILNLISDIVEKITKLEILEFNKPIPLKIRKINQIKTITGTLQIEGNSLNLDKVTAIIEGKRVLAKQEEILEVKGVIKLYKEVDKLNYREIDDLLKAHKLLMDGILTNAGNFRDSDVGIGGKTGLIHIAPPKGNVGYLMKDLFEWLKNSNEHPLIASSVFHYEFEFIHPFVDGNGRLGRFWQTLILYNWKKIFLFLPIESIIKENQKDYYKALEQSGRLGESTPFIEFILGIILQTSKELLKDLNVPKNDTKNDPKKRLKKILQLMKRDSAITIKELSHRLSVSEKTIKRDIAKLKEQNRIKRVGSFRSGYWELDI